MNHEQITLANTQIHHVHASGMNGLSYQLYVGLPSDYADSPEKRYPVLYVLDGEWDFKLCLSLVGALSWEYVIPQAIIVGHVYGKNESAADIERWRMMNYLPKIDDSNPIGAQRLAEFFRHDVIPLIESSYRCDGDRVLLGCSAGGCFAMHTFCHAPGLFTRIVAASPGLYREEAQVNALDWEAALWQRVQSQPNLPLTQRLFMSAGELEPQRDYSGLKIDTLIIKGEQHATAKAEGYNRGLRSVFAEPQVTLSQKDCEQIIGQYDLALGDDHTPIAFKLADGDIAMTIDDEPSLEAIQFRALSPTCLIGFRSPFPIRVHFENIEDGRYQRLSVDWPDGKTYYAARSRQNDKNASGFS